MISPSGVLRRHFQLGRQRLGLRDQRVIAARPRSGGGRPANSSRPSCSITEVLPCISRPRAHHLAAEGLDDATGGRGRRRTPARGPRTRGSSPSRRRHRAACPAPARCTGASAAARSACLDRDLVVALHVAPRRPDQEGLHQVVGEGIVVVDQQQPRPASWTCSQSLLRERQRAAQRGRSWRTLLRTRSRGTLSATMPAPAW